MPEITDSSNSILRRMLDANSNRAMEGLRTLEDIARFADFGFVQGSYKGIRHELQGVISSVDRAGLLAARDSDGDVGRDNKVPSEGERRDGLVSIANAAASRVEQGLRVIEESLKVLAPEQALLVERLRYRIYDANAMLLLGLQRDREFINRSNLYVLVDCKLPISDFKKRIKDISLAGVDLVQVRDKSAEAKTILSYAYACLETVDPARTRIIVNDRADIACVAKAAGVHVGQEDLSAPECRRLMQAWQYVGLSTHDLDQVISASGLGVDYIGCGPTFPSGTKNFSNFSGLEFLRVASEWLSRNAPGLPAFAIGGIHGENIARVLDAGFRRVAVSGAIWNSESPGQAAQRIKERLEK